MLWLTSCRFSLIFSLSISSYISPYKASKSLSTWRLSGRLGSHGNGIFPLLKVSDFLRLEKSIVVQFTFMERQLKDS